MSPNYKIIFSGPVGAGKTTAINSISDIATIKTEACATDKTKEKKKDTTVALDYGAVVLKDNSKIHLYGTPGQKRFDFMWDILTIDGTGLLLLIDGSDKKALDNLQSYLDSFKDFINKTGVVIGITKHDNKKQFELSEYRNILDQGSTETPIFEIDTRSRKDVALMIETLLYALNPQLSI